MRENTFLALGSPLVDVIATVDESFLHKYGLQPSSAAAAGEKHEKLFRELENLGAAHQAGGCALNAARSLQWALKAPRAAAVLGAVGRDGRARLLRRQLEREGVNCRFEEVAGEATGRCAVLLTGSDRSLCTDLAASGRFSCGFLKSQQTWRVVEEARCYYAPGFFLGVSPECLAEVAKHSLTAGKVFCFNLSAPFVVKKFKEEICTLFPYIDIIFGNEAEARAFAATLNFESGNLHDILLFINSLPKKNPKRKRLTVVTRGPDPVCLVQDNTITEHPVSNIKDKEIVDTNAAGDAFVGGFLAAFILNQRPELCVMNGNYIASEVIKKVGCSF